MGKKFDIAIVGGGIVGLAHAYWAAQKGKSVIVFERNHAAQGASIRNFGLVWPIGQRKEQYDRAMRGRAIWLELAQKANFWCVENGSLHLAYEKVDWDVLQEFEATTKDVGYKIDLIKRNEIGSKSKAVNEEGLIGAMYSATELNVDPRQAVSQIANYISTVLNVQIVFNTAISYIDDRCLGNNKEAWQAEQIVVCSGADLETLFPEVNAKSDMVKCKLQMLRTGSQAAQWMLGASLCAGLTLRHYAAFEHCQSLKALDQFYDHWDIRYKKYGIHVLLSQTALGELTIGDSHEYGNDIDPFDRKTINQLILKYLNTFAKVPSINIEESWHGVYAKIPGKTEFIAKPIPNVTIVNALSGAGMTLSFGLAEEIINNLYL